MKCPIHGVTVLGIVFNPRLALYFPQCRHHEESMLKAISSTTWCVPPGNASFLKYPESPECLPARKRASSRVDIPCWLSPENLQPHLPAARAAPTPPCRQHLLPVSPLWEAVKGWSVDKNSCVDFTWLNNKTSWKGEPNRQESKAPNASPASSLQRGSADWPAPCPAREYSTCLAPTTLNALLPVSEAGSQTQDASLNRKQKSSA